jgi:hypothetical protein
VLCVVDSHRLKLSGRSHSHVGLPFHELEGYLRYMMSRGYGLCSCIMDVTRPGNEEKGVHSEGKGGKRAVAIPWFQGGKPHLC